VYIYIYIYIYRISWEEMHKQKELIRERILNKRKYYFKRVTSMPLLRSYHHHPLVSVVTYNRIIKSLQCTVKSFQ
jgi:hypothetical protein